MAVSKQWNLVRDWLRKTYNKEVHEFFKDLPADLDPNNTSGRSTTKAVCLIGANDSQGIAAQKQENFRRLKEQVGLGGSIPSHDYERIPGLVYRGNPQVQLWFLEKYSVAKANNRTKNPHEARVSFRLFDDWSAELPAKAMALKIKNKFAKPIFSLESGELKICYLDESKGYNFTLLVPSKAEAKQVIEAVMDLNGHTPDWNRLRTIDSDKDFTTSKRVRVVGETITVRQERIKTVLYFRYAIAKVPPRISEIPLVDTSMRYYNAFYREPNPFLGRQKRSGTNNASPLPLR